jgi:hypothetical protein
MYKLVQNLKLHFIDIQQDPNIAVPIKKEATFLMFPLLMSRYVIRSSTTLNITRNRKRKYVRVKSQGKSMLLCAMKNIERQYKDTENSNQTGFLTLSYF